MTRVGLPASDQEAIFRTVAAILHLGNIVFVPADGGESCVLAEGGGEHHALCAGRGGCVHVRLQGCLPCVGAPHAVALCCFL